MSSRIETLLRGSEGRPAVYAAQFVGLPSPGEVSELPGVYSAQIAKPKNGLRFRFAYRLYVNISKGTTGPNAHGNTRRPVLNSMSFEAL
jgi:hypothetical protein